MLYLVMRRISLFISLILITSTFSPATAASSFVTCSAPKRIMATVGFEITCEAANDIDGAVAHLQYFDGATWKSAAQGDSNWQSSTLSYNRIYKDPKSSGVTSFRVVTDALEGVHKSSISNQFDIEVYVYKAPKKKSSTTQSQTRTNPRMVTIPNIIGMPVQWVRTHQNSYPGIHLMITGSSCAISDVLSGDAVIVGQNPAPMQSRPFNTIVILRTNC